MKIQIEIDIPPEELEQAERLLKGITALVAQAAVSSPSSVVTTKESGGAERDGLPAEPVVSTGGYAVEPGMVRGDAGRDSTEVDVRSGETVSKRESSDKEVLAEHEVPKEEAEAVLVVDSRPAAVVFREELEAVSQNRSSAELAAGRINVRLDGGTELYPVLEAAMLSVLFDSRTVAERVRREATCVPVLTILTHLPQSVQGKIKEELLKTALKVFRVARAPDCNRMDFYGHAEAVAGLVRLDLAPVTAAVKAIITLLKIPENRCAAVTLLGKTIELCSDRVKEDCDPQLVDSLREILESVTEPQFQYDLGYVEENMQWTPVSAHRVH